MTEFKKFKLGKLFQFESVRQAKSQSAIPTDNNKKTRIPYIVQSTKNNMFKRNVNKQWLIDHKEPIVKGNCIALGVTLPAVSYQSDDFGGSQLIIARANWLNETNGLYIAASLKQQMGQFSYSHKPGLHIYKSLDILLPVTPSGDPDFAYMTRYIQDLEAQRIQDLDAYLKVSGQDNTELTDQEKAALTKKVEWKKFVLGKLFDIQKIRGVNKSGLTNPSNDNNYDYITRTSQNNGIESHSGLVANRELNENGTYSLGLLQMTFFYRERPWYAGQFVRKIVPKINLTREQALYFLSVFNALRPKLLSVLVRNVDNVFSAQEIELPVNSTGAIDFTYMQDYITALEKLNIKDVVAYKDKVIAATKQIISQQS